MKIFFLLALAFPLFAETNCPATMTPAECSALKALHPQNNGASGPVTYLGSERINPPQNPELDAANKKIAELTAQLADSNKLLNAYAQKYQTCDVQLTQLSVIGPPKTAK